MTVFVFSAWLLALVFAAVLASWAGGDAVLLLPGAVVLAGAALFWLTRPRGPRPRASMAEADRQGRIWDQTMVHVMSTPALTIDHGVVAMANRALLTLLGYRDHGDQVVGLQMMNLLHPIDHEKFDQLMRQMQAGPAAPKSSPLRLLRADGTVVQMQARLEPLGEPGTRLLVQMLASDEIPEAAPDPVSPLDAVVDQLNLVILCTDRYGRITYVNRAWERMSGRSADSSIGLGLSILIHAEDRDAVQRSLLAVGQGELDESSNECRLVTSGDSPLWVLLHARAYTQPDRALIGIAATVTELPGARQHKSMQSALRRHSSTLLANVPGMVYRSRNDRDWTMEFVSDGAFELTGFEPEDLIDSRHLAFARLIHEQDRDFVWTQVQTALARHEPYQLSFRLIDVHGQERWVWDHGQGVFSAHGELLALEGFICEVNPRRETELLALRHSWFEARTGMSSREVFAEVAAIFWRHAQWAGYCFAVVAIDLIGLPVLLERLEDSEVVDHVLEQLVRRLTAASGPTAVVCRVGGNEFAVLLTDFRSGGLQHANAEAAEVTGPVTAMARRMAAALSAPLAVGNVSYTVAVAVGIALNNPRYLGADAMLQAASVAAERAARRGSEECEFAQA